MKILRLYNEDNGVDVQYKTDLISPDQSNFTCMTVEGLDEAEIALGITFRQLPYNLNIFKEFATENGLGLSVQNVGPEKVQEPEVLVEPVPVS